LTVDTTTSTSATFFVKGTVPGASYSTSSQTSVVAPVTVLVCDGETVSARKPEQYFTCQVGSTCLSNFGTWTYTFFEALPVNSAAPDCNKVVPMPYSDAEATTPWGGSALVPATLDQATWNPASSTAVDTTSTASDLIYIKGFKYTDNM
jgi:hypothetical protein